MTFSASSVALTTFLSMLHWTCGAIRQVQSQSTDAARPQLLFAKPNGIVFLELTSAGANVTSRIAADLQSEGVTFDMSRGHVYWATHDRLCRLSPGGIYRANTDGSGVTKFISTKALSKLGTLFQSPRHEIAFESSCVAYDNRRKLHCTNCIRLDWREHLLHRQWGA